MRSAVSRPAPAANDLARLAPAKVNLALNVTGRRTDGYHLIDTLAVFTRFGDEISVADAAQDSFAVCGPYGDGVPPDASNLVLRARDLMRAMAGPAARPASIVLKKRLPPASGIGGGSSDAAATLRALAALWKVAADEASLRQAALALGADLPMCLVAEPLIARGIGEEIAPAPAFPALALVLVNPGVEVSTPAVFARLEKRDNPPLPPLPAFDDAASVAAFDNAMPVAAWLAAARNDLEIPAMALAPAIRDTLAALDAAGAQIARMSGSGATCYGLFASDAEAQAAAGRIAAGRPDWFVQATRSFATGEFHGGN